MALSGNFNTNKYTTSSHGTIGLNLSWTATQSIVNNTTKISWTLKSNGTMSSGYYVQAGPVTVTINGTKVLNTTSRFSMKGDGAYKKTGTITVSHAADGSKSVSMSVKAAIYSASVNCTGSKTYSLNKINRYALLENAPSFTDEEDPTITFTNPAGTDLVTDLKVRLTWAAGSEATSYFSIPSSSWGGGSYTMDLSSWRNALRASTPNSNSMEVTYDLMSTLNGTQYNSTKVATMNIVNANPTVGALSFEDTNATIVGITGSNQVIVQKQSTLQIHSDTSTANKGATIASEVLTFNGSDYTPDGSGNVTFTKPNIAGTYSAVLKITDSRGNSASRTLSIPIHSWSQPSADYSFKRTEDFTDNEAVLNVKGNISAIPGSSLLITETHREKDTGTWSEPATVPDGTNFTISNLDYQKEYELIITVSDSFTRADSPPTNTTYTVGIGKGIPLVYFDILKHSVSVNGITVDNDQLFVGGTIKSTGKITAPSMSVTDISSLYTLSKTSGNWKLNEIEAVRSGNVIHIRIAMSGNGSSVSAGSNGFVGTLSGGPLPALSIKLIAYYNNCPIMMNIEPDGSVTARVTATSVTVTTTGTLALTGTFITND